MVEVIFALEEKYGIELPFNANTSADDFVTVGDVISAVEKKLTENAQQLRNHDE